MKLVKFKLFLASLACAGMPVLQAYADPSDLPLISIDSFKYQGGFRMSGKVFGDTNRANMNYSNSVLTYNAANHSLFLIAHPHQEQVGEFLIPELSKSTDISDFKIMESPVQNFTQFWNTDRVDTGIEARFKATGLELIDGKLLINYVNWYDGSGKETDTSVVFQDANNLANSIVTGPYQLNGAAHAAGWLSEVPLEWQSVLGGTHISGGQSGTSINSRLSVGPSAFTINPADTYFKKESGEVDSTRLLDFPLKNLLYNKELYGPGPITDVNSITYNENGKNDLWTIVSGAGYGFIAPNSRTYVTLGKSGGHVSGLGYKATQIDGHLCSGPCAYDPADYYSYYWLWDVNDLLKVKNGELNSYDVRPYNYGKFDVPIHVGASVVNSGSFDAASNTLYMSMPNADKLARYSSLPVFVAYSYEQVVYDEPVKVRLGFEFIAKGGFYLAKLKAAAPLDIDWHSIKVHLVKASEYDERGDGVFANSIVDCGLQTALDIDRKKGQAAFKVPFSLLAKESYVYAIEVKDKLGNKNVMIHRFTP